MDIRVEELLERVRKDGVEAAKAEAARIVAEAEGRKAAILADAEREAREIEAAARDRAAKFEAASNATLAQASRNLVLAFRDEIGKTLSAIVRTEAEAAFDADALRKALPGLLEAWVAKGSDDVGVLLSERDARVLEAFFREKLAGALRKGVELRPAPELKAGFRIVEKDGSAYYDFSAEAVAAMLGRYLNAKLAGIVASAAK